MGFGIICRDLGVFRVFEESVQQLGVEVVTGDELVEKIGIIFRVFLNAEKAIAHHFQSSC